MLFIMSLSLRRTVMSCVALGGVICISSLQERGQGEPMASVTPSVTPKYDNSISLFYVTQLQVHQSMWYKKGTRKPPPKT